MKKILTTILLLSLFASCSVSPYYWGSYEKVTYKYNKNMTPEARANVMENYQSVINYCKQSTSKEVPPGIYADYGYLLIQDGQVDLGKSYMEKEMELYPESKKIVTYLLDRIK
ncbi:DUF4810 domain-containing protein [Halosquirtibacter xylanolyticus]|uniref:DUF4810 domain-containing protein n=1 Tax=Halosquirtibacter xylanolyticus TaxID=3374599 RepID=UPI003749CDCC|nr:DUF4810 domain-containing protein [Prolixibacteraceae bacterium]